MTLRLAKISLVAAVALFYTLVVFNNTTDYGTNYQFVHHVLLMDTTSSNGGTWRALHPPIVQTLFYGSIIAWETLTMVLTWIGVVQLACALRKPAAVFNSAKRFSIVALTLGMLLWFVAFIIVGGEWFLMWLSKTWNGQDAAFRMFAVSGIVFILLVLPDTEAQP